MTQEEIINTLLQNRGITDIAGREQFFNPPNPQSIPSPVETGDAIELIRSHIMQGNKIAIFGDYDVDGVSSTAMLWECLYKLSPKVFPHIPHRHTEGYGLSQKGAQHCIDEGAKLIVTIDCGIVSHKTVEYIRSQGCDVIIIDHHEIGDVLPSANVIVHSTATCAAGLAWFMVRDINAKLKLPPPTENLSLAALGVICDMVPLLGTNRSLAKFGLEQLKHTTRPGLLALLTEADIQPNTISTYHVGFVIGPRINAMGRLEHAIDSLRLLCTTDNIRARQLAGLLSDTNKYRQELTENAITQAMAQAKKNPAQGVITVYDPDWDPGIIGLVASKIVEKFYHPALAMTLVDGIIKGSARSVSGVHITDILRNQQPLLLEVGGHAMAAGYALNPQNLEAFCHNLNNLTLPNELLVKQQRIDLEIPIEAITRQLFETLQTFEPFGLGNPTPVFSSIGEITQYRRIGQDGKHAKTRLNDIDAVFFNAPDTPMSGNVRAVYTLDENTFNGRTNLQLKLKELV